MLNLTKRQILFISIVLIIIIGFAIYVNSLNGKFIWDDEGLIKDNLYIKQWLSLPKFFTEDITAGYASKSNFYRPFQMITYMIDYSLWKFNVIGYHLSNVLLHVLVALAIYWLVNILYSNWLLSFLTSILFIVHPLHTGAVAYISGRADSLATLFMLTCFIFYIKHSYTKKLNYYIFMLLSYILALLSKENSLILPALLLLYHYAFKTKFDWKVFLSILSITFYYILLRSVVLKSMLYNIAGTTTLFDRLPGFFVALANYIKLLILPFKLHIEYGKKLFKLNDFKVIAGAALLLLFLTYAFRKRKSNNLIFFSISWFFITLLPVSNLYPINAYMAEHWLYLPSIGFFLILANGLSHLYETREFRIFTICFVIGLSTFYSYLTIRQNNYWKDPVIFYKRALEFAPRSSILYNNLGKAYIDIGENEKAISLLEKAIEINQKNIIAYNNLGAIYNNMGKKDKAVNLFRKAIEIDPNYMATYNNLVRTYDSMGKKEEAMALCKKAIEIGPYYADIYYILGNIYANMDRKEESIEAYRQAVKINPTFVDAHNNLCEEYTVIGNNEEAIKSCKKAIQINPSFSKAHYNLGNAYANIAKFQESMKAYKKAIEIEPNYIEAYNNLASIYSDIGKVEEAIALWNEAVEIDPNFSVAHFNLAKFYFYKKKYELAIKHCDKVVQLGNKVDPEFLRLLEPYRNKQIEN